MSRTQVWSSGGGVQSTAIAALIVSGKLPKPDLAVIADTGYERSTTWDYLEAYTLPALKSAGVELERVSAKDFATVGLYRGDSILIPAYTTENAESDDIGKLPTYCSNEWKRRVIQRWVSSKGATKIDFWMGFTIDEAKRAKVTLGKWQNKFPLIDLRMNRSDCISLVEAMGWPEPPRSACYMCPQQSNSEWRWQKAVSEKDHLKAVEFENAIREKDPDLWLTAEGIPLVDVDLSSDNDLFGYCNTGHCFV